MATKTKTKPTEVDTNPGELMMIRLESLIPADDNVRSRGRIDPTSPEILEMAITMKSVGVLEPLLVEPHPDEDGSFRIKAGERRYVAAGVAGLEEVPCLNKAVDEITRQSIFNVENMQRETLSPIEQARSFNQLAKAGVAQRDIGKQVGVSQGHVSKTLGLLKLPEKAQEWVETGELTQELAFDMAKLPPTVAKDLCEKGLPRDCQITNARIEMEREARIASARRQIVAEGLTATEKHPETFWSPELIKEGELTSVAVGSFHGTLSHVDREAHATEPCHVVFITRDGHLLPACTDPGRHPRPVEAAEDANDEFGGTRPALQVRDVTPPTATELAQKACEESLLPAYRTAVTAELDSDDVISFVATALFRDQDPHGTAQSAIKMLELAETTGDPLGDLATMADESMNEAAQAMTAFAIRSYHEDLMWIIETAVNGTPLDVIEDQDRAGVANARRLLDFLRVVVPDAAVGTLEEIVTDFAVDDIVEAEIVEDEDELTGGNDEVEVVQPDVVPDLDEETEVDETSPDEPEVVQSGEPPTVEINKAGSKFYRVCSACGPLTGFNTNEEAAQTRVADHLRDEHGIDVAA